MQAEIFRLFRHCQSRVPGANPALPLNHRQPKPAIQYGLPAGKCGEPLIFTRPVIAGTKELFRQAAGAAGEKLAH